MKNRKMKNSFNYDNSIEKLIKHPAIDKNMPHEIQLN